MSTTNGATGVLRDLSVLAAEQGWSEVTAELASFPDAKDALVALLVQPGVDGADLADWLDGQAAAAGGTVQVAVLGDGPARGVPGLAANRVVVALRAGELVSLEAVAALRRVIERPQGSYAVVFLGAERLTGPELGAAERALEHVTGAAAPAVQLWAPPHAATSEDVADRVATDVATLASWIAAPTAAPATLELLRVRQALDLADLVARQGSSQAARAAGEAAQLRTAHAALVRTRDQLPAQIRRDIVDAGDQLAVLARRIEADAAAAAARGSAAGGSAAALLEHASQRWRSEGQDVLAGQLRRAAETATRLLEDVDWALVNKHAVGQGAAGARYPARLLANLDQPVMVDSPRTPAPAPHARPSWPSAVGAVTVGTALAGLAVSVTTPIVAAMVGVSGGIIADRVIGRAAASSQRDSGQQDLLAALTRWGQEARRVATHAVTAAADAAQATLRARFDDLLRDLDPAVRRVAEARQQPPARPDAITRLQDLHRRLERSGPV